jgi:hypothetical protein
VVQLALALQPSRSGSARLAPVQYPCASRCDRARVKRAKLAVSFVGLPTTSATSDQNASSWSGRPRSFATVRAGPRVGRVFPAREAACPPAHRGHRRRSRLLAVKSPEEDQPDAGRIKGDAASCSTGHLDLDVASNLESVMSGVGCRMEGQPKGLGGDHLAYRTDEMAV